MCGIAGQLRSNEPVEPQVLQRMCTAMRHRGPDSEGIFCDGRAGLGIRRLRVIDLKTGDQPVASEDGSVTTVLNGEIYNFRELRHELRERGHTFTSAGDTEVIVHLYEEMGPDFVRRLHGMFAIAVWDAKRRRLVLARDRAGKKPLYYSEDNDCLTFASELNALTASGAIEPQVDYEAIAGFLAYRWVPGPRSAFAGVRKLPPASMLVRDEGGSRVESYWRLDYNRPCPFSSEREMDAAIRDGIRAATRRRLVSDVPLGAFLSGGVDSSAVVAAMAEASPRPVRTFSIGFADEQVNELPKARLVAERFGAEHHEFVVEPDTAEMLPRIVRHYGEPFADPAAIATFCLSEMARRHVTVALNGDGGDESFGGYTRYVSNAVLGRVDRVPSSVRHAVGRAGLLAPEKAVAQAWPNRIRRLARALPLAPAERYAAYLSKLNGLDLERLLTPEFRELTDPGRTLGVIADPWGRSEADSVIDRMLDVDVQTYLPDYLLTKVDIATMAYSLEGRSPLLDHELMELAASLPGSQKVRGRNKKVAFRRALRGWIPDEILDAPKQGFKLPIDRWLREELRESVQDLLLDRVARERGYFRPEYVRRMLDRHSRGEADHSQGIWTLLTLELWNREFIDGGASRDAGANDTGSRTAGVPA